MFYHITDYFNSKKELHFKPRIPNNAFVNSWGDAIEDTITKRVCFCKTIYGCLLAKSMYAEKFNIDPTEYNEVAIYGVNCIPNILEPKPTYKYDDTQVNNDFTHVVPDCDITGEVWSLDLISIRLVQFFDFEFMTKKEKRELFRKWRKEHELRFPRAKYLMKRKMK